jgi:hypothetical protein
VRAPESGTLAGLDALTAVTRTLEIFDAQSLDALAHLETVGGDLSLDGVAESDLSDLPSLRDIGGALILTKGELETLNGLTALESIRGPLVIGNVPSLRTIGSLGFVTELGGLSVALCDAFEDLHGLEAITRVNGMILFADDPLLTSLSGLDSVTVAAEIVLTNVPLEDISALGGITALPGMLTIENTALTDLEGLHHLTSAGSVKLYGGFTSLRGLRSLVEASSFAGRFDALHDFTELESLTRIEVGLVLSGDFATLAGFEGVDFAGDLRIAETENLTTLAPLSGITELHSLDLTDNRSLVDIEGLQSVTRVQAEVRIEGTCAVTQEPDGGTTRTCLANEALTSLRGLRGLESVGGRLVVQDNPALPACEAEWLRDAIGAENIGGEVVLAANDGTGACP